MTKHLTVTGDSFDDLAINIHSELKRAKIAASNTANITLLMAENGLVDYKKVAGILKIVTDYYPNLEFDFETAIHQYNDICLDISWQG